MEIERAKKERDEKLIAVKEALNKGAFHFWGKRRKIRVYTKRKEWCNEKETRRTGSGTTTKDGDNNRGSIGLV
jgi:hypothetical protein